jgi:hypothetical protein
MIQTVTFPPQMVEAVKGRGSARMRASTRLSWGTHYPLVTPMLRRDSADVTW